MSSDNPGSCAFTVDPNSSDCCTRRWLRSTRQAMVGESIEKFFQFDFAALERRAQFEPSTIWPVRDLAHGRRFFAIARAPLRPAARTLELAAPNAVPETADG